MLEGLAAWILNTYVGEYLENLNTDQLSIGLLQGFVGKIKLQIPVSRLRSEPWVIFIERLFLIAGPISSSEYDEETDEASALSKKLAQLSALEAEIKVPKFVKRDDSDFMWKLLKLQGLSLYWDTKSEILSKLDPKEMMAAMGKHFESPSSTVHEYILSPVNADAHLTRNCSLKPLRSDSHLG
ncbi:vacuolar protein sorting-associated protein 13D [Caerostris extrusa]|uniref:Vacuolar protein sorting-associated protein 13D n=1 Tax=Caerostris extrusa TaxID=172846 RepID=A0AAV4TU11_CAEEX|nr:vacuolar protein sorting-associated protein 13D [Caerostris extrusa]